MTSETKRSKRPASVYALIAMLFFQGVSGIGGGIFLVIDPSGETIGFEPSMLEQIPFESYLIPGLILTVILGIAPTIMAGLIAYRKMMALMWWASVALGIALVIWLGVEYAMIGYTFLLAGYAVVAVIILALTVVTREFMTN